MNQVAVDENGKLQAIDIIYYADLGCTSEDNEILGTLNHWDNGMWIGLYCIVTYSFYVGDT